MAAKFRQSGEQHVPFFDSVMGQGLLQSNLFTFAMGRGADQDSSLTFGWVDESQMQGDISWHQVVLPVFWSLPLDRVTLSTRVGGEERTIISLCGPDTGKKCLVTPDSGTSQITFPTWAFHKFERGLSNIGASPSRPCPPSLLHDFTLT